MRKYDQPANEHVCTYLRLQAKRLGQTVSRQAGVVAHGRYANEVAAGMVVFPVGQPVPYELRELLALVGCGVS